MFHLLFVLFAVSSVSGDEGFYIISHMANTPTAFNWAVAQGANAVEMDIDFDDTGNPVRIYHGFPCDCTCKPDWLFPDSVCPQLAPDYCSAEGDIAEILTMANNEQQIAMVYIDSKVSTDSESVMQYAGTQMASLLITHLFELGYDGKIVVGASDEEAFPYLMSVATAFSNNQYGDHVFFSFDSGTTDVGQRISTLHSLPSSNVVFSDGSSSCFPTTPSRDILQLAVLNKVENTISQTYIWTIDSESTMEDYMPFVNGIISNYPQNVKSVALSQGRTLATRQSTISSSLGQNIITDLSNYECDCDYSWGGCEIVTPAPPNTACYCRYIFFSCVGYIVLCDPNNPLCSQPDTTENSCILGGGDCDGY